MKLRNVSSLCLGVFIIFVFVTLFGIGPPFAEAQVYAYVSAQWNNHIVVIDISTNSVVNVFSAGPGPRGIKITPDGTRAYMPIGGSWAVAVIDTAIDTVIKTIPTIDPGGLAITPNGNYVYVTNWNGYAMSMVDISTNIVVDTVNTGYDRHFGAAVTPNGSQVYVANVYHDIVSVIDTSTNIIIDTLTLNDGLGEEPCLLAITPDGSRVYVSNRGSGTVSVIDTSTNSVLETIVISGVPSPVSFQAYPEIAINRDGTRAYVSDQVTNSLAVIDTSTNTVLVSVPVGAFPAGVAITPDGSHVWVSNVLTDNISVIDTSSNQVTSTINLKDANSSLGWPVGIAFFDLNPNITVTIDIKPGNDPNSINPKSRGVIPVAILTTDAFDATTVDGLTVRFGPDEAEPDHYALEDVDLDGDLDMMLQFRIQETGIECGDTEAILAGETGDGRKIKGADSIRTVGCKEM